MNILVMADYTPGNSGNFIGSLHDLARYLKGQGGSLVLAVPGRDSAAPWEPLLTGLGCPVVYLGRDLSEKEKCAEIDRLLETYRIDLIHVHFGMWIRTICKHRYRWARVPILAHDHFYYEVDAPLWKQKLRHWINAAIYRFCRIGVISVMEKKNRGYFLCGKNHWHIPNAISYTRNVAEPMPRGERRAFLGVNPEETLCLFLGWSLEVKGLDIAIQAVRQCREQGGNLILGIVGLGAEPDEGQRSWILDNTGISPEEPWIRYFPSTEDMYSYYRAADLYLSASRTEAFPYSILEAISQDMPVVISSIPGSAWAREFSRCVVFETGDVGGCARAIPQALSLAEKPSNREELIAQYSIDLWCQRIVEIYRKFVHTER